MAKVQNFKIAINIMREKIEGVVPKIERFINAFAADPEQAISDLVNDIGNFFRDAIFGKLKTLDLMVQVKIYVEAA